MPEHIQPGELKPCPFCGAGETVIHINPGLWNGLSRPRQIISMEVRHWCTKVEGQPSSRMLTFVGRDRESALAAWNRRAA